MQPDLSACLQQHLGRLPLEDLCVHLVVAAAQRLRSVQSFQAVPNFPCNASSLGSLAVAGSKNRHDVRPRDHTPQVAVALNQHRLCPFSGRCQGRGNPRRSAAGHQNIYILHHRRLSGGFTNRIRHSHRLFYSCEICPALSAYSRNSER